MYFLIDPPILKGYCNHLLRLKHPQGTKKVFACCVSCGYKVEVKN